MKNITVYPTIWQTIPYAMYMNDRFKDGKIISIKDVILTNTDVLEREISEMTLNVTKISVLDVSNKEHVVTDFKHQVLNLKGMYTGRFIKSRKGLNLNTGSYSAIRFYLGNNQNSYVTKERAIGNLDGLNYLDFQIEDGLEINRDISYEIILRFDFVPFTFLSNFKPIREFFKKRKYTLASKLEGSLES